ncbi:MAG: LD-carboxypeptidase, partial [Anaerolineae bacterium]|nr:LD-carboxypeptidase [Anaerolineae bacterium]
LADMDSLYRHPQRRADDVNAAFADPDVKAIIATIGGDDSVRILDYLDLDTIRANPKIIMGYSDTSTLLAYLNQQGVITFHGPMVMAGFAQLGALPESFTQHVRTLLLTEFRDYLYRPYGFYTERYLDWNDSANTGQVEPLQSETSGWQWLQGEGKVQGRLFGGCIEVLEFLKGTRYWPEPSFWNDRLLFFETSEEAPPVHLVQRWLRNYGVQGIFERVRGILFGRARDYSAEQKTAL